MYPDLVFVCLPEAQTRDVMKEFSDMYEQQYAVALFNSVRFEIEGAGGPQSQLLHRKVNALVIKEKFFHSQTGCKWTKHFGFAR